MALKDKIDFRKLPPYARIIISAVPAVIITIVVVILLLLPKNREIKAYDNKISVQENEIAKRISKAQKLPEMTIENERLKKRLAELKEQLPEEKEVSGLLKQVSDLCIKSGLRVLLWKPEQKKTHSSGIVYEIPVKVELSGSYHNLGFFFSRLTKLSRIVNISDIKISDAKLERANAIVKIAFTATTFSAIPKEEMGKAK